MRKYLYIVHPGTGTILPLSDEVYLLDSSVIPSAVAEENVEDWISDHAKSSGYRLDNYNMMNLFFGDI